MKKFVLVLSILLLVSGCGNVTSNAKVSKEEALEQIVSENNYVVVDVRTREEYLESHVVGAVNIPYDTIDENVNLDKDKKILVYCRSGKRSSIAYETLKKIGYDVFDLGDYDSINLERE